MSTMEIEQRAQLAQRWAKFWQALGAARDGQPYFDALYTAWNEPTRAYHTPEHLLECLTAFDAQRVKARQPLAVEAALWFHDAIYDARQGGNEARSAEWARSVLGDAGADAALLDTVHSLIMATTHAALPADADERLLVDIDLSILGAARERFDRYDADVRREYQHVPAAAYRIGRRRVLRSFLKRGRIYATDDFYRRYEAPARANLRRAIRRLWWPF